MRWSIKQCKFCPLNESCEHREKLRATGKDLRITVVHNCKEFIKQFKVGEVVLVDLMNQDNCSQWDGGTFYEWEPYEKNPVKAIVSGEISRGKLVHLYLMEPVDLLRKGNKQTFKEYAKPANQCKRTGEIVDIKPDMLHFCKC